MRPTRRGRPFASDMACILEPGCLGPRGSDLCVSGASAAVMIPVIAGAILVE